MPISKSTATRITAVLLLIGLAAMLGIVGTSWWLVERTNSYFEEVAEAREARRATVDLRNDMQEIDASKRGFLLTGDETYLNTYYQARDEIDPGYQRLTAILAPYPQSHDPMAQLRETLDAHIANTDLVISLQRAGNIDEAMAIFGRAVDREMMREARAFLDAVVAAADARLADGVDDHRSSVNALRLVTVIGGLIVILVVGASVWTTLNYTRDLVAAREEVEALNAELEGRVEERTQELVRANQEIQRFAYIVTHDLRAPLVNIMGFTSELDETMQSIQKYVLAEGETLEEHEIHQARTAAAEDLPEAIGFIRSSTKKMDGLINAILKISRDGRRQLKPESIDLKEALETITESVHHQVSETEGEIHIEADMPPIVSDRLSLDQIFGNLVDNAVKYRAPDRPLTISVAARQLPGRRVAIDVTDNGRGIAPQDHERIFDLFRRSGAQDQPGEGIGLAHVRSLVRNLGGEITLQSKVGEGTTFTVTLPEDARTVIRSMAS